MKVLTLLPQAGLSGGPLAGLRTSKALASLGVEQEICLGGEGPMEEEVRRAGLPFFRVSAKGRPPSRVLGALLLLHRRKPHLLHVHSVLGLSRDFALAARVLGIPVVWHIHEDLAFPRYRKRLGAVRALSTLAIAVSRVQLEHLGGVRALHLPNGVDPAAFPPPSPRQRSEARRALGLGPDRFVVLFLGRICRDKGCHILARALETAFRREKSLFCLFAGQGKEEDLREIGAGFPGGKDSPGRLLPASPRVLPLFHAADLLVLPSLRENCPLVVLEALATGLPVLASPEGDLPQILSGGTGGRLLPPQALLDPETLASFLVRAARGGGPTREVEGTRGRERVLERYSLASQAARLYHIFQTLAGNSMEEKRP